MVFVGKGDVVCCNCIVVNSSGHLYSGAGLYSAVLMSNTVVKAGCSLEVDRNRFFQFRPKPKMYRRHGAETETETETEHTYSAETETRTEHFYFVINVHP